MTQRAGEIFNSRYELLTLLGEGGMGAVYRGRDLTLQREVAVKVMHAQFAQQTDFRARFLQEARAAANLNHPGIVKVYDFGQASSALYIVMEFIDGGNLADLLSSLRTRQQWLLLPEALQLLQNIALALDYAHHSGVLHRDIKPANIMIRPERGGALTYQPVITDLGLAKLGQGGMVTQTGTSMGTPAYMSPEQAQGETTDVRSDVYSLGVLFYELALGQRPFPITTLSEALRYHGKELPPAPASIRPDVPKEVAQIILKALEKDPAQRFQSAAAMAAAIGNLQPHTVIATAPPTAKAGAAGLMTHYQASLLAVRGQSVLEDFPSVVANGNQIQVLTPDHKIQTVAVSSAIIKVGRDADNQIVLNDEQASRQHVRIEFAGTLCRVTDLNSRNGSYLGPVKLLPGVPETWTPDKALRIGSHYLRLVNATAGAEEGGTFVGTTQPQKGQAPAANVAIFVATERLEVEAGGNAILPVILINQGTQVDHFSLSGEGEAAAWVQAPAPVLLMPSAQQEVRITVHPPRAAHVRAGEYRLTVRVSGQSRPGQTSSRPINIRLLPYYAYQTDVRPQEVAAGKPLQIGITNQGNAPQNFQMTWSDRANELTFAPPQAQLDIAPGATATVDVVARTRRRWVGATKTHPITIQVQPATGQQAATSVNGAVVSRAAVPPWVPPLLFVLLAGLAGLTWRVFSSRQAATVAAQQTATAIAQVTQIAQATQGGINEQSAQAATATAVWLNEDDDRDGLINRQELAENTKPDQRDTDEDGLDDGIELNKWGTNPLVADTDGDGLKDGDEVSRGLDPNKDDTDGDGNKDAADPDPGHAPTPTPKPTDTPRPTDTPLPTAAPPTAVPPTIPAPTVADFSGAWYTNFAEIRLQQSGNQVTGNYQWYGNSKWWDIQGIVTGDTLSGHYMNDTTTQFAFTINAAFSEFDGYWYSRSTGNHQHWCGVKSGPLPDGCGFSGFWYARSNQLPSQWQPTVKVEQVGAMVTGVFDNGNPNGTGTINGQIGTFGTDPHYNFVGTYQMDADGYSNRVRWTLRNNNDRQFVGCSISNRRVADWLGWRDGEREPATDNPATCP